MRAVLTGVLPEGQGCGRGWFRSGRCRIDAGSSATGLSGRMPRFVAHGGGVEAYSCTASGRWVEPERRVGNVGVSFAAIAEQLRIPEPELERKALKTFLEAEFRSVDERIMALIVRYRVRHARGLEELISQHSVEEHPAWEDLIEWEGLEARREKLLEVLLALVKGAS